MNFKKSALLGSLAAASLVTASAQDSRPSVVVTIENTAPYNGGFLTPVWVGFHNGQFDSYDGGTAANTLPIMGSDAIERLAEDGNTGPISRDFSQLVPNGSQGTIRSNGTLPPLGPSQIASQLIPVDPSQGRYFSYASMIIPSNDAFVANGNPKAHEIFDTNGNFVGESFYILGSQVDDAGTEVNDELPANTAFFGQAAPNTGVDENGIIPGPGHPGLNAASLGGVLASPIFREADFTQDNYNLARVKFTFLDTAAPVLFQSEADARFESPRPTISAGQNPEAQAFFFLDDDGESLVYFAFANELSGNITAAHLHLAPLTQNGPVVLPLRPLFGRFVFGQIDADDVTGPLAGRPDALDALVAEMSAGTSYLNIHTAANPAGEIRGQVNLSNFR